MVEWWLIQGDIPVVREVTFFNFLTHTKALVEAQRRALRTGSKKKIEECKVKERALLDYVSRYEAYRIQMLTEISKPIPYGADGVNQNLL